MMDLVTRYATSVVAGQEIASRLVIQACARHLDDLAHAGEKGLTWKPDQAVRACEFFPDVLVLPERTDADEAVSVRDEDGVPLPFVLQPWQQFIVGSLFGWYTTQGFRRFREALIETAKGSGKTPLCAGMLLYMLVADGELGAQVFMAATTREQATIAFTDAKRMVEASPYLSAALDQKVNNLAVLSTGSFLRAISAEKRGLDGKRVHGAMVDELHEAMPVVVNKMRAGTKGRRNALILKPTNSGFDRTSVLWQHHEYSRKVLDGTVTNESWFAFICGLDPCDACVAAGRWFPAEECESCDDWKTEGPHWRKANPNLGVSLPWQYVRERVSQAKGMPSEVSDVLRFNFCVWTQGASRAIDMGQWAACQDMPMDSELVGAPCYGGLDLGETDDFSAWTRIWLLPDGRVAVKTRYWIPQAAKERFPSRPYGEWERAKLLTVTDGNETDYEALRATVLEDCANDGVIAIAFDPRSATETAQELTKAGIVMIKIPQGFGLNEAIRKTLELVSSGDLCHGREKILAWMASNVVLITGTKGDKRLAKEKSPEKIDGISSLVNAIEWGLVRRDREAESVYRDRGVKSLEDYL
jgi:phage terminase large subunit-like protein